MPRFEHLPGSQDVYAQRSSEYLAQLCAQSIVGFVMRQVDLHHQIGDRLALDLDNQSVSLGECVSVMTITRGRGGSPDCGPHQDAVHRRVSPGEPVINFNSNDAGIADWEITDNRQPSPVTYGARVYAGDTVVLLDYLVEHEVKSVSDTRTYSSGLYVAMLR